jgi:chromate reductase, NAD(P)H dehydrogenase (quinone)
MTGDLRVLALSGSLREKSYNTALLREAQRLAPDGVTIAIASIAEFPLYNADLEARAFPQAVRDISASVAKADALFIATPEYNFSIPGVLKNAIGWLSRPPLDRVLAGKPVAIAGAGGRLARRERNIICVRCAPASACCRCRGRNCSCSTPGKSSTNKAG